MGPNFLGEVVMRRKEFRTARKRRRKKRKHENRGAQK
jgi:hypothetical protein